MTFYEWIIELRKEQKIPKKWKVQDIRPYLQQHFARNMISVYPYNASITPDGKTDGDSIIYRPQPKFYRFGKGEFGLISDFSPEELSKISPKIETKKNFGNHSNLRHLSDIFTTKEIFDEYQKICNQEFRKVSPSLFLYRMIIEAHTNTAIQQLLDDNNFFELLYVTLIAWNMNMRKAKLKEFDNVKKLIINNREEIVSLSQYEIQKIKSRQELEPILNRVVNIFNKISVMQSKAQIVGTSKLMHFLLPQLVMPIDRTYTLKCIYGHNQYAIEKEAETFKEVFTAFHSVISHLQLKKEDADGDGWNTTIPKIVDNAIIGYMKDYSPA